MRRLSVIENTTRAAPEVKEKSKIFFGWWEVTFLLYKIAKAINCIVNEKLKKL